MIISEEFQQGGREMDSVVVRIDEGLEEDGEMLAEMQRNYCDSEDQIHRIMVDQDTMESNEFLISSNRDAEIEQGKEEKSQSIQSGNEKDQDNEQQAKICCKELIRTLKCFHQKQQETLQSSYEQFEQSQRRHLQKMKIVYSHFILKDRQLTSTQLQRLKSIIYLPKCGEGLIQWGNKRYNIALTPTLVLQRIDHLQKQATLSPKAKDCKQEARLCLIIIFLLIVIKLMP